MQNSEYRVLIVEDVKSSRTTYASILAEAGFVVDTASNLEEALEKIDAKTYHLAFIDVMLAGEQDVSNEDGLKLMEKIQELSEGTKIISLSGQSRPSIARDILKRYGAEDYIDKQSLNKVADIIEPAKRALANCRLNEFGTSESLFGLLAGNRSSRAWEDKALRLLVPNDGYSGMNRFFDGLLKPFLPLIPSAMAPEPTSFDYSTSTISGRFWSKKRGFAVEFFASRVKRTLDSSQKTDKNMEPPEELLLSIEDSGLYGYVFGLKGENRKHFVSKP